MSEKSKTLSRKEVNYTSEELKLAFCKVPLCDLLNVVSSGHNELQWPPVKCLSVTY